MHQLIIAVQSKFSEHPECFFVNNEKYSYFYLSNCQLITMPKSTSFLLLLFVLSALLSCSYDNEEDLFEELPCDDNIEKLSLQNDIVPILNANCYSCHASDVNTGGIDLENYESLKALSSSGQFLGAIQHTPGFTNMPPSSDQLDACSIEKIRIWIEEGAQNN